MQAAAFCEKVLPGMSPKPRRASPAELRRHFNEAGLAEKAEAGELLCIVESERLAPASAGQPRGTVSRTVSYDDDTMHRIALVHEHRLPDGSLGGSGQPDPKRLLVGDEILFC